MKMLVDCICLRFIRRFVFSSNDVFVPYQHVNFISGALPHGGDIVEAASLAVS